MTQSDKNVMGFHPSNITIYDSYVMQQHNTTVDRALLGIMTTTCIDAAGLSAGGQVEHAASKIRVVFK